MIDLHYFIHRQNRIAMTCTGDVVPGYVPSYRMVPPQRSILLITRSRTPDQQPKLQKVYAVIIVVPD